MNIDCSLFWSSFLGALPALIVSTVLTIYSIVQTKKNNDKSEEFSNSMLYLKIDNLMIEASKFQIIYLENKKKTKDFKNLIFEGKGMCFDAVCFYYCKNNKAKIYVEKMEYIKTIKDFIKEYYDFKKEYKITMDNMKNIKMVAEKLRMLKSSH